MEKLDLLDYKLTELQEKILLELEKTTNYLFICKKLNVKSITITKTIKSLENKKLFLNNSLTENGKKMIHYIKYRNEIISLFLKNNKIENTKEINKQLSCLDYKIIIALSNYL